MSFLSQEIVDYLNQTSSCGSLGDWLEQNPVIHNFVTCPYLSIRPTAMPYARRITAFDGQRGRFIDILYRDGSHCYMINVASWDITVEDVETFMQTLDRLAGSCHVERSFLVIYVPVGYALEIEEVGSTRRLQLHSQHVADIGRE